MAQASPKRRNTHQRQLILDCVQNRCDHPSADDIYLSVRALDPKVSRATVYRNLHLLVDEGEIISVHTHGIEHFDRRQDTHAHVVCDVCGRVDDVAAPENRGDFSAIENALGYSISREETIYHGICAACKAKLNKESIQAAS